jgi:hypothetical protein
MNEESVPHFLFFECSTSADTAWNEEEFAMHVIVKRGDLCAGEGQGRSHAGGGMLERGRFAVQIRPRLGAAWAMAATAGCMMRRSTVTA